MLAPSDPETDLLAVLAGLPSPAEPARTDKKLHEVLQLSFLVHLTPKHLQGSFCCQGPVENSSSRCPQTLEEICTLCRQDHHLLQSL